MKSILSRFPNKMSLPLSIKEKFFYFIITLIIVMSGISICANLYANSILGRYNTMFQKIIWINNLTIDIDKSYNSVRQYLITGNRELLEEYIADRQSAEKNLKNISGALNNEKSALVFIYIQNMFNSYVKENLIMINKYQTEQTYLTNYQYISEINRYINTSIKELMDNELAYNKQFYEILGWRVDIFQKFILIVLVFIFIAGGIFSWRFSEKISNPIQKLSDQAVKISNGQLEMKDIEIEADDEIGRLTTAFNDMIHNIQKLIIEIKEKAKLETLLKETELKALQSQVNPHFLFNILGGVTEAALLEGADKTLSMVEDIASLLRYSLTNFHKAVTLEDEIRMVQRYIFLQSHRFGNRIKFITSIPDKILLYHMPCMTIQPFVENAIIHGLESQVGGGNIHISVNESSEAIIVNIEDDGAGIDPQILDKLMDRNGNEHHIGHTTGIGVNNVSERLKMFFGQEGLLEIKSKKNVGTCIKISLPINTSKNTAKENYDNV